MENLVNLLKNKNLTISSMESCTGGLFSSEITNIDGSSKIFKLGLVTYCNEYKEYFGIPKETINKYSVYSNEVSKEMAKSVSNIAKSDIGIGITGLLGSKDPNNENNNINTVYISIYHKQNNSCYDYTVQAYGNTRIEKKIYIVNYIRNKLFDLYK